MYNEGPGLRLHENFLKLKRYEKIKTQKKITHSEMKLWSKIS